VKRLIPLEEEMWAALSQLGWSKRSTILIVAERSRIGRCSQFHELSFQNTPLFTGLKYCNTAVYL
jgi:hypothetical protein